MMDRRVNTNSVFVFIFSFFLAVFVSSFITISPLVSILILLIGCAVLIAEKIHRKAIGKEVLFLSLAFVSFGLGSLCYAIKDFHELTTPSSLGIVITEPELRQNSARFVMSTDNGEKVLVNTDLYTPVRYGDRVEVTDGKLERPGIIENEDGGRPFNYGKYLAKDDIYYTLSFAQVEIVSKNHGNFIKQALFKIKRSFVSKTKDILTEPQASLLSGLIVSGREAMPEDVLEEFRRAGVIHIVVLSGYNITIIAESMRKFFENLFLILPPALRRGRLMASPRLAVILSIIAILLFVIMTGAEATVVRASIMVLVVITAKMFGRPYSAPRALLVAAFLMLIHNPKILVFDPSFQLSFLATLALIYVVPIVENFLIKIPEKYGLRLVVATTIATQLTVLPLLVYSIGDFSLVSLPANVLILLFIPTTMFVGFIATTLSYLSHFLAIPFAYIAHVLLTWILEVSSFLGNLSFASIRVPLVPIWSVVLAYLLLIIFVRRFGSPAQSGNYPPQSSNSN